ncbi:hypothetical protein CONCODRAFT_3821 [Conidiobolus coronatus NRRL 28638]|uniref:Uncharacterized protein n=1 Tax=Conidiobolus coronatus (strain ATCC 28846 / CBS 209.66 / NRRL 28638) TaxID=796925 RepID=A0A137PDS5_CONC2|nr:hypothetical protein CONCODRAFT_3821 [Conidiobolus coronatus NRRL 28638]|eukprot:KXN73156.1 hypothetical protein CONCODRAFT_3821 [Conidiobolus coronatus NRRL 28638]
MSMNQYIFLKLYILLALTTLCLQRAVCLTVKVSKCGSQWTQNLLKARRITSIDQSEVEFFGELLDNVDVVGENVPADLFNLDVLLTWSRESFSHYYSWLSPYLSLFPTLLCIDGVCKTEVCFKGKCGMKGGLEANSEKLSDCGGGFVCNEEIVTKCVEPENINKLGKHAKVLLNYCAAIIYRNDTAADQRCYL